MQSQDVFSQVLKAVESRRKPMVKLALRPAEEKDDVLASKILGMPYWEDGTPVPLDRHGKPLQLMAQLNLALVPRLPWFPAQGVLQFFIADDTEYGYAERAEIDHAKSRVIYWPLPDIRRHVPYPVMEMEFCPADAPLLIEPEEITLEHCGVEDHEAASIYTELLAEQFPDIDEDAFDAFLDDYVSNTGCKLGGFAFFTQGDPRDGCDFGTSREWIQLLQLDSVDAGMMWGDAGIAHWFIRREDLERRDFSKVFYTWDCC